MDWDEYYQKGEVFWDKGAPAPALRQYLECHAVRGRALVPGCGRGHEVAVAVEHGLDATGRTSRRPEWRRRVRCIRSLRSVS